MNNTTGEDISTNQSSEFDREPVTPQAQLPARHFAASYAGEHVAGTEFVIGATFVAWGVSTVDVIVGLVIGNLLAVLSWGLICAPIATDTRLTLYAYLEKIAGPGVVRIYSIINGAFFCVLGGAMITVSASAVRILFGIEPQVHWYPTDPTFILVAMLVGAVVVAVSIRGFAIVARFAEICAPWMILMFAAGALAIWPQLASQANVPAGAGFWESLRTVGDSHIWVANPESGMSLWHVAAFAWICNLPMHIGLSDMTVLRFARRTSYGYFSVLGMFIGHFGAWIAAGIMGAGAALLLKTSVSQLDAGEVAFQVLGTAGIIAVIIAGWTTSNPTFYRAGLAFQSLNHKWSRYRVTMVTGIATTIIACFPFVFTKLMDFLGLMGLLLAPMGAIIVTEHWLFPRFGLQRYWSNQRGDTTNTPALAAWAIALLVAFLLNQGGVHLFFLLVPAWTTAMLTYLLLARSAAASFDPTNTGTLQAADDSQPVPAGDSSPSATGKPDSAPVNIWRYTAWASLLACAGMAIAAFNGMDLEILRSWLILPSLIYFVSATIWINRKERAAS